MVFVQSGVVFGLVLLATGAGLIGAILFGLRAVERLRRPSTIGPFQDPSTGGAQSEAALIVESGGRVLYINQAARQLFNLHGGRPHLESLARRTSPSEAFLKLCASEGAAGFSLNGRFVEGRSYAAPPLASRRAVGQCAMFVALRQPRLALARSDALSIETDERESIVAPLTQALEEFSELNQAIASSLDPEKTVRIILERVARLLPCDWMRLTLYDEQTETLTPYQMSILDPEERRMSSRSKKDVDDTGAASYLINRRLPLLIQDLRKNLPAEVGLDKTTFPYLSFAGAPLISSNTLVGALELAALAPGHFSETDLQVLQLLANPAASALKNARLYQREQQRALELAGLSNLTQSVSALSEPQDLYRQLIESIQPLMAVEVLGFLTFDDNRRTLHGETPFLGITDNVVGWYQTAIEPGSRSEELLRIPQAIVTEDATADPCFQLLDLDHLAEAAGFHRCALQPLAFGGRNQGFLLAAKKKDRSAFDSQDLRLLSSIAGQTAPIIDNAHLVQQSRLRTQRAETLRRIASLISSAATPDEILRYSIIDLARLLQVDFALLYILDESHGRLCLHKESLFGLPPEAAALLEDIPLDAPDYALTVTASQQMRLTSDLSVANDDSPICRIISNSVLMRSSINLPLVARQRAIGELLLGSLKPDFFSQGDIQLVVTASGQLATAMDGTALTSQSDQALRQKYDEMSAIMRVSRELNRISDLKKLLPRVLEETRKITHADCGSIVLFRMADMAPLSDSPEGRQGISLPAVLVSAGEKHPLHFVETDMHRLLDGAAIVISDYDHVNSERPHQGVQSGLVLSLMAQSRLIGLVYLHAAQADRFGATECQAGEAMAGAVAMILGNTLRSQDQLQQGGRLQRRLKTYASLLEAVRAVQPGAALDETLVKIAGALQEATAFNAALVSLFDEQTGQPTQLAAAGVSPENLSKLREQPLSLATLQALCQPKFQLGSSCFVPAESPAAVLAEIPEMETETEEEATSQAEVWRSNDLLITPLQNAAGELLGYIRLAAPRNGLRPERSTVDALEVFAAQTSQLVERQRSYIQLAQQVETIASRLESTLEAAADLRSRNALLLQKEEQQTAAVALLDHELGRMKAVQVISNRIGGLSASAEVYECLGDNLVQMLGFDLVLLAEPVAGGIKLSGTFGQIPPEANPKALLGQENPLRHCLQKPDSLFVSDIKASKEWKNTPLLRRLGAGSFVCFSIPGPAELPGIRPRAAILAITRRPSQPFSANDEHLFSALAGQAAAALDNQEYIEATSRRIKKVDLLLGFSQQLGTLEIEATLVTLMQNAMSAVPAAQSAMVALWDEKRSRLAPRCAIGYRDEQELMAISYQSGEGLPGQVFERRRSVNLAEVNFAVHYRLSPENFRHYRNATGARLPISSLAVPIISGAILSETDGDTGPLNPPDEKRARPLGVLVLDSDQASGAFTDEDLAILVSLVQQTALNLENARLYLASEQRSSQLQALTDASTHLTASLDRETLVDNLLDQLGSLLPFDTGTLWLRERERGVEHLRIASARGFTDNDQRLGLRVDVADSLLMEEMIRTGKPIWAPNVKEDPRFQTIVVENDLEQPDLSAQMHLSWLGVPLISSGQVMGVIALEKTEPGYYSQADIQAVAMFASQAAAGLDNASLYQESVERLRVLDEQSQTLTTLNRLSSELNGTLEAGLILFYTAQEFQQLVPCTSLSVLMRRRNAGGPEGQTHWAGENKSGEEFCWDIQLESPGLLPGSAEHSQHTAVPNTPVFERLKETLGIFSTQQAGEEPELTSLGPLLAAHQTRSLLVVPIASAGGRTGGLEGGGRLHGFLLAHHTMVHRYDHEEIALARTICNLAATALHNAQLYGETRDLSTHLEQRVRQRTAELEREQQRSDTLVQIITELSASLDLTQVLTRTLNVLGEYVNAEQIMILIARPGQDLLQCISSVERAGEQRLSRTDDAQQLEQILGHWIVDNRDVVLIDDARNDARWNGMLAGSTMQQPFRNVLGVPLMSGAEALGCLILLHTRPGVFSADQLELIQAAANQVSISVNNAELYRLIRDQAEDLGGMLRRQQIETTRTKAILEAVADGVLVTDATQQITLFNRSAEDLLGIPRSQIIGKSIEDFTLNLAGAAQKWQERIQGWSHNPAPSEPGETFAQELTLQNGRVLYVHLAPVNVRDDFLGTVSIIQDITHRIEVDRLKSEFVATVSHELRTPMTSIKGYVEILLMGAAGQLNPQQTRFLDVVRSNADRLGVLVDDLLDISQIEAGKLHLTKQPVRIEEIVDQTICDLYRRIALGRGSIEITKEIEPNLPIVMADAGQIRKVIDNLLENAYLYNLPDGQICVRVRQVSEEIQVDVKDSGVGITLVEKDQVFERFFRGANSLALGVSGTGLGLSIVKNLVLMHDGRIWVDSLGLPGAGSTFSFTLPVCRTRQQEEG